MNMIRSIYRSAGCEVVTTSHADRSLLALQELHDRKEFVKKRIEYADGIGVDASVLKAQAEIEAMSATKLRGYAAKIGIHRDHATTLSELREVVSNYTIMLGEAG